MRLDGATIGIERRSVGACVDLAILFYRAHLLKILPLTCAFAAANGALVHWLGDGEPTLFFASALFYYVSPLLGAVLVAAAGRRVFGEPFRIRRAARICGSRSVLLVLGLLGASVASHVLLWLLIIPGVYVLARYGFLPEVLLLEQVPRGRVERRIQELTRGMLTNLSLRLIAIFLFHIGLTLSLFILADLTLGAVFDFSLFFERLRESAQGNYSGEIVVDYLFSDPLTVGALHCVMWIVYPLARLAWFFCYLDVRIQEECWDLELDFRVEAERLALTT